ncbi:hypothetical protein ACHWQZ_G000499 [Mnemiopsis leidyi]
MILPSCFPVLLVLFHAASSNLRILTIHGNQGPEPCAMTCVGTTAEADTRWTQDPLGAATNHYIITTTVNISQCGFVGTPIVTTSLHTGNSADAKKHQYIGALVSGQSTVADLNKDSFKVYLYGFHGNTFKSLPFTPTYGKAFWDVHWSASGFIC